MTRFRIGTLVLLATATLTFAVAWFAMSPRVVCEPVATVAVARPEPKVLYVESVAGTLVRTLGRELDVTSRTPAELPRSADRLARYDLVVLSDVPMHLLDAERIAALDAYVRGGGSLLVGGGADSLGSGSYDATALEKMLPARFGSGCRLDQPGLALVVVVDQSMQAAPMAKTREAVRALSESLSPNDYIAVIGFDDDAHTSVRAQRAANRRRIAEQVADLVPSARTGGNVLAGLRAAGDILDSVHAASKHVIVVVASDVPAAHVAALTAEMSERGITASAIAVGADEPGLPDLLVREAAKAIVPDDERVRVRSPNRALSVRDAPPLQGYVSMRTKPTAETLLVSDHNDEPLLARWCHGAGTVLVWTSDLDHEWSRRWVGWGGYASLWSHVIRTSARGASECSRSR